MQTLTIANSKKQKTSYNFSPELELLLCCTRTKIDDKIAERIKILVKQDIDWQYLVQTAMTHGVMPLLYWNLKNTCPESVPNHALNFIRKVAQHNSGNNLILTQELVNVLRLFQTHQIPALPFKGPLLATSVYGNLSLRYISDLDILVSQENFQKAADLLVAQGYKYCEEANVRWESHLIKDDGIHNIDLHCEIVPRHLSCSISENYWWENTEPFSLAGLTVPNLLPEAQFFLICLNGNKECWKSLNRICDVAEVIRAYPQMDWQEILDKADKLRCKRLVALALFLAKDLLQAPVPEAVLERIQLYPKVKVLAQQITQQLFVESNERILEVHRCLFHIKTRENLQSKIQVLVDLMNYSGWLQPTEKDLDLVKLPKNFYFLYYLVRPIRVFQKYQRTLLEYIGIKI
ncbi:hypothetical protein NIES4071_29000 [Calothrix sp. NIES-4071]|nr:hypothetical protein NIES4071_29000 [Calothrix sp. NIES-4071]BAZ57221.1 hypothetical protein NIES4105_28940 [Calothrix sp. NIES-4105]